VTKVKSLILLLLSALLLVAGASVALAAGQERPAIVEIDLYVEGGQLTGDITTRGIFSERILGTVQSGLPAVMELFYHLAESGEGSVEKGVRSYSLRYDVWDDVYSVAGQDTTVLLPSLQAMRSMIQHMKSISLVPIEKMMPNHSYFVEMSVAVNPLQGTDKREVAGWIKENVRSKNESSWHEQLLNVNELITHFFSREKDSAKRSEWVRSAVFRPERLPSRSGSGRGGQSRGDSYRYGQSLNGSSRDDSSLDGSSRGGAFHQAKEEG
jgi:hypothetical protein